MKKNLIKVDFGRHERPEPEGGIIPYSPGYRFEDEDNYIGFWEPDSPIWRMDNQFGDRFERNPGITTILTNGMYWLEIDYQIDGIGGYSEWIIYPSENEAKLIDRLQDFPGPGEELRIYHTPNVEKAFSEMEEDTVSGYVHEIEDVIRHGTLPGVLIIGKEYTIKTDDYDKQSQEIEYLEKHLRKGDWDDIIQTRINKYYDKHPELKAMPWKLERELEGEAEEEWMSEHPGKWPWDSENMAEVEQYIRNYRGVYKLKGYEKEKKNDNYRE